MLDAMSMVIMNVNLLSELLKRLPAKSLLRFKSVCKLWLSVISSPYFARLHVINSKTQAESSGSKSLVFFFYGEYYCITQFTFRQQQPIYYPLLSCDMFAYDAVSNIVDGLICLFKRDCRYRFPIIYNLVTREHVFFPMGGIDEYHDDTYKHKGIKFWCYMGFDSVRSEYKLLTRSCGNMFDITTLGSTSSYSWRRVLDVPVTISGGHNHVIDRSLGKARDYSYAPSFYVDGIVYWLEIIEKEDVGKCPAIASFNFVTERVRIVEVLDDLSVESLDKGYYITKSEAGHLIFGILQVKNKISRRRLLLSSDDSHICSSLKVTDEIYSYADLTSVYPLNDSLFAKKVKVDENDHDVSYICYDVEDGENSIINVHQSRWTDNKKYTLIQVSHVTDNVIPLRGPRSCHVL